MSSVPDAFDHLRRAVWDRRIFDCRYNHAYIHVPVASDNIFIRCKRLFTIADLLDRIRIIDNKKHVICFCRIAFDPFCKKFISALQFFFDLFQIRNDIFRDHAVTNDISFFFHGSKLLPDSVRNINF